MSKQENIPGRGIRWAKRFGIAFMAMATLSGCEGVHLYNPAKDKTAADIQTKKSKIDIEKAFKTERKNLSIILGQEIEVRNRFVEQVRSRVIWDLVYKRQTLDSVLRPLEVQHVGNYAAVRLRRLGVYGQVTLDDAAHAYVSMNRYTEFRGARGKRKSAVQETLNHQLAEFKRTDSYNWTKPYPCSVAVEKNADDAVMDSQVKPGVRENFRILFESYQALCANIFINAKYVRFLMNAVPKQSLFHDSSVEFNAALAELKTLEGAVKLVESKLPKKKMGGKQEDFIAGLQKETKAIAKSLGSAADAAKFLGLEKALTEERVGALSVILRAFGGGALPDLTDAETAGLKKHPGMHRAAIIAAALPEFEGDIKKLNTLLSDPGGRAGLAIQFGYLRLKLKHLNRRTELIRQRAQLAADQLRAHLHEAVLIRNAGRALDAAEKALMAAKKSVLKTATKKKKSALTATEKAAALKAAKLGFAALGGLNYFQLQALPKSKAKRLAIQGILQFDMAISVARRRADALSFRLIDTRHQEINEADAFAAKAWNNLLDGPIQQIRAYHLAGIKTEEISEILSGLAGLGILGFIGVKEAN